MLLPRRIFILLFLGFASGLPIALTTSTLSAWYTETGASLSSIGFLSLIGQPYIYKFLWAPLLDHFDILKMGRRRSWMILTQIILGGLLFIMSFLNPQQHGLLLACMAVLVAVFSSTQDIAISGYLTEAPRSNERGMAVSFYITSYRLAMIFSSAVALIIAQYFGWHLSYMSMGIVMVLFVIASILTPEPPLTSDKLSFRQTFTEPFKEMIARLGLKTFIIVIIILICYKMTDAFALSLSSIFFLRELHYSLAEMGMINKVFGTLAGLLGGLTAGILLQKIRLFPALVFFGIVQAFGNAIFIWLYLGNHTLTHFAVAVFIDNFASGLASTAFVAFMIGLCNKKFSGTQFALLSALTEFGRVYLGPVAALTVGTMGWVNFFLLAILVGLVAVCMLYPIKKLISNSASENVPRPL